MQDVLVTGSRPAGLAITADLQSSTVTPSQLSQVVWEALWPRECLRKHHNYSFGLEALMRFNHPQLCCLLLMRFFNCLAPNRQAF